MRILKFGGSSVASPDRIVNVGRIVLDAAAGAPAVVVVSAFQGVTNDLLECARLAERRNSAWERGFEAIAVRHGAAIDRLIDPAQAARVHTRVDQLLSELNDALRGVSLLRYAPPSAFDSIASFGERLSALIIAEYLNGFRPARFVDARQFIVTDDQFMRANVHFASTGRAARRFFSALRSEPECPLPVVTGFIGSTKDGRTTTVGRNGSDYTAAIVGAALHAAVIEIWTDVDGVLSADPKSVASPAVLPQITYGQAHDLSFFGAKVLHPATIAPAVATNIPILIKNTFNPDAPGTLIRGDSAEHRAAAGVTSMPDVTLVTLRGSKRAAPRLSERLFRALADNAIDVLLTSQASSDQAISVAVNSADADAAAKAIAREFRFERRQRSITLERQSNQSLVALVGNAAVRQQAAAEVLGTLARHGIEVAAVAEGGASRTIACVIEAAQRPRALNIVHRRLFDSRKALGLAIAGVGTVGSALLRQLAQERDALSARGYALSVVGLANSRGFVVAPDGIDLENWRPALGASQAGMHPREFAAALKALDLPACAFVDCTASDAIVNAYPDFIDADCHIIAANKRPLVLPVREYARLADLFTRRGRHFLYEGTVGAGLPIISTIQDLAQTGDSIVRIEGAFSGTLSYLFNRFDGSRPFSALVREAHRHGFTEPDPREDLAAVDVARKLLILAREAGAPMDLEDVSVESLLPSELDGGLFTEEFFSSLAAYDDEMAARVNTARSRGCVLRYVGTVDRNGARAALQEVSLEHPLAGTRGADNMIAFTTARYRESPLVIQGPGAGPDVTAMGLFSDILKLLHYLPH
jgi:aspartokinase/homoserine dehydrogenase 1